jgi:hypothetical protein
MASPCNHNTTISKRLIFPLNPPGSYSIGLLVLGLRDEGLRVEGLRVEGLRVVGFDVVGFDVG